MEETLNLEERFQPYLADENHYTFVGPSDLNELTDFIRLVNLIAPTVAITRSLHHALSNKGAVREAIKRFQFRSEPRVYILFKEAEPYMLHSTIEEYCRRYNINFE